MKKLFGFILYQIIAILFLASCSSTDSGGQSGNIDTLLQNLEKDGFIVQEGNYIQVDAIDLLDNEVIRSANGNNADNPYFSFALPMAPGQTFPNEFTAPGYPGKYLTYRLRSDEALLLVGRTPPEEIYFSFRSFITSRYSPGSGNQDMIFGALGDTINSLTVNGGGANPFNQPFVIVTTADRGINSRIKSSLNSAGYPSNIVNDDMLPGQMLNMGLDRQSDTFTFISRNAQPANQADFDAYLNNHGVRVFRLTPVNPTLEADLYPRPSLKPRGTGRTEAWLQSSVDDLRTAILNRYTPLYEASELPTSQWLPETLTGIDYQINVIGESRDTPYLWTGTGVIPTGVPASFILPDDPDEFLIVYGVNHQASNKATYSNFTVYGAKYLNGVASVSNLKFGDSAGSYIPGNALKDKLYAWKVVRRCNAGDIYCLPVPFGPAHRGFGANADDLYGFIGFRAYLEPATTVGAKWDELIFDRVIKFKRKY